MLPPNLYARVRALCVHLHARPRVRRAPGLPCALYFERAISRSKPRASARENADTHSVVVARESEGFA